MTLLLQIVTIASIVGFAYRALFVHHWLLLHYHTKEAEETARFTKSFNKGALVVLYINALVIELMIDANILMIGALSFSFLGAAYKAFVIDCKPNVVLRAYSILDKNCKYEISTDNVIEVVNFIEQYSDSHLLKAITTEGRIKSQYEIDNLFETLNKGDIISTRNVSKKTQNLLNEIK